MSLYPLQEELPLMLSTELGDVSLRDQVTQLFVEAREDVYRYLLTLGLYPPQAQEAAQEVFLRLYVALRKGDDIQNRRAWIFRVAHNLGLKVRQRQRTQPPFEPEMEARLSDPRENPERDLLERERQLRLHSAIKDLSDQQKRCLFLRMEGLRYAEIAEVLGISIPTVGEFLRRAIHRLRKVTHE
jgi:RNA polymerase sigma-70 factor (ECF subfamily)